MCVAWLDVGAGWSVESERSLKCVAGDNERAKQVLPKTFLNRISICPRPAGARGAHGAAGGLPRQPFREFGGKLALKRA